MILIDTDVLIDVSRGLPLAVTCLQEITAHDTPVISAVTQMELIVGCRDKVESQKLDKFLKYFQICHITEPISQEATELLRRFRLSHGLLIPDTLIAATAIRLNMQFVSKNQKDYRFIPALGLLPYPHPFTP